MGLIDSHWWSPDDYFEGGRLAAYGEPVRGTDDPELFETERRGNFSYAIPASPGRYIEVPTLVLHGDADQIVPIADSAYLSSKIVKNATLKVIEGAPHGMCTTRMDEINAALLEFLKS